MTLQEAIIKTAEELIRNPKARCDRVIAAVWRYENEKIQEICNENIQVQDLSDQESDRTVE